MKLKKGSTFGYLVSGGDVLGRFYLEKASLAAKDMTVTKVRVQFVKDFARIMRREGVI